MAYHKEFETAGKELGLQVWRVEKGDLVPVPSAFHGHFYIGDAYIVLNTLSTSGSYNVHTWTGKEASQDESGGAAILMFQLDDFLNGVPRQFTEFQGNESAAFMSLFKSLKYKKGGVASGFKHVEAKIEKRLLHVKGRRNIRASEVDLSWASFNKGDSFIIDLGEVIYCWRGSQCNKFECLKATELAIDIRDDERGGRPTIKMVEEGSEPEEILTELGQKPDLPDKSSDDLESDRRNKTKASLHSISDSTGTMKTTMVSDKAPFKQSRLNQSDLYLLDSGDGKIIFVWKGKKASVKERRDLTRAAASYIEERGYPPNTQIQVMPEAAETTLFKQFFLNWLDKYETTGPSEAYSIGSIARVKQVPFDASTLHSNAIMAAQHGMVDDGSGKVQIWRVEGGDKVPVDPSTYGQFFGGDCYLVLYSYKVEGRERHIIYTWQGLKCSKDELGASAILTIDLDDSMGGVPTQVRVTQGQEPTHFVSMFKDKPLVIHLGGTSREHGESEPGSTRLFHIRQSSTKATRAVEVEPKASSLNTNDVFVLKSSESNSLWKGKGATQEEMAAAEKLADLLVLTLTEAEESNEPPEFWKALGGKEDYQTSKTLQKTLRLPRLFGCSNKTGRLIVEEVPGEFTQLDLATDDVMILDIWAQIFIWIGEDANETEKSGSSKIADEYVESDPSGRRGVPISIIRQGEEPLSFTGWFLAWDSGLWAKDRLQALIDSFGENE